MLILVMMMAAITAVMRYKSDSFGSTGNDDVPPEDGASKVVRSLLLPTSTYHVSLEGLLS